MSQHKFELAPKTIAGVPVSAMLSYVPSSEEAPTHYTYEPPAGIPWENVDYEQRMVSIADARATGASLEVEGFELWSAPTSVSDFTDKSLVESVYYEEMKELVRKATGGRDVYIFDHLLRAREPDGQPLNFGRRSGKSGAAPANGRIHNDYTVHSGIRRIRAVLDRFEVPEEKRRYSIINVWRSIGEPEIDTPLALCDSSSVSAMDLVEGRVVYPKRDGWIYVLNYSPKHRWNYFSNMTRDEVILFKQFDTEISGATRFTPHSAFQNPIDVEKQRPRRSIEMRCLVAY
ncbi:MULTISPECIES: CmcJ/NvfI family oxidoreductase [unclassified Marinobacter]|uniref:CmcJ/NvfI family oxidoreductase n=1 Tax=unclassified Marinobacter TaxID=83889 RepID=UPI0019289551|nr:MULTISPECIES: CmcJ/NvfI family oxidoreductase [unclassified Marinobacter]MBL3827188.1 hypothetical protein [Marinobacter sp. MC3]MBL3895722.1 hypothetical protein [Marinobacter sp. MW3]